MARIASVLATLGLALVTLSCGGSPNEEKLAQLEAENEALRTRLAEQDAEELRTSEPPEPEEASKPSDDDWAWAEDLEAKTEPPERSTPPVIEPAPEPKEPPAPKPERKAPEPEPVRERAPEPKPEREPEPQNRLEMPEPEPEPEPIRRETRTASAGCSNEDLMQAQEENPDILHVVMFCHFDQ